MKQISISVFFALVLTACATTNPPVTPAPDAQQSKLTREESDDVGITGSIDKEAIRSTIREHARPIQNCYAQALNRDSKVKGKVVISWDIADTGKVTNSSVYSNDTSDERLAQCVRKELAKITYAKLPKGQTARILYPFAFSSSGELTK